FSVKSINANASSYSNKYDYPDLNSSFTYSGGNFNVQGTGNYALNEKVTLGLYARVYRDVRDTEYEDSGAVSSERTTDFDFAFEPSIEYKLKNNLSVYASFYRFSDDADVTVDQDGIKDFNGNDHYTNTVFWTGVFYKKDIKPNVMLDAEILAGLRTRHWQDEVDSTDTYQDQFLLTRANVDARYFLANNFSVDGGIGLSMSSRLNAKDDGVDVDFGNDTYKEVSYGTRLGFTFYYR
ncbi:MAG: hypothetical protein R3309_15750, partial [Reinekea sp.]|nr:hypothetical protein [Reinekea sp.]